MDTSFEERIVEIDNGKKYYVIKQLISDNNIYLLANLLVDEDTPSEEFSIIKVINFEDGLKLKIEDDEEQLPKLLDKFDELI